MLLMLVYIAAIHNNSVILLACGLPFDRALPWHKMLAASSILHGVIHLAAFYAGGRADTMVYARDTSHHIFKDISKAYGMEVTGPHYQRAALKSQGYLLRCGRPRQEVFCHLHYAEGRQTAWAPAWQVFVCADVTYYLLMEAASASSAAPASTRNNGVELIIDCRLGAAGVHGRHVCHGSALGHPALLCGILSHAHPLCGAHGRPGFAAWLWLRYMERLRACECARRNLLADRPTHSGDLHELCAHSSTISYPSNGR